MTLPVDELIGLFGDAPTMETMLSLGFKDLQPVIDATQWREPEAATPPQPVPEGKVESNAFSPPVRTLLQQGFIRSQLVGDYFKGCSDPQLHDRISAQLKQEYANLKSEGLDPDRIFDRIRRLVGGVGPPNARRETAVLAIVAYFFAICDIFEPSGSTLASTY